MFKVISDIMAHWHEMWNTILIAISFSTGMKMICALMLIISNHYGMKCISNLIQLEPCNVICKLITDIMPHSDEVQLLLQSMKRQWLMLWCFPWAMIME